MATVPLLSDIVITNQLLGRGRFTTVHKAKQQGVDVAAKVYNFASASQPSEHLSRLLCSQLAQVVELCHPHLVAIIGVYQAQFNQPMIISPIMELGSVHSRILANNLPKLSFRDALDIVLGVLRGLRFLHEQRCAIVHSRLSDYNVLLQGDGCAKISDYGMASFLAKAFPDRDLHCGDIVAFLPPEVITKGHAPTVKADVFAVGVLLMECVLGSVPAAGENLDNQTATRRRMADLHRLHSCGVKGSGLPGLVQHCFEPQPTKRPSCMQLEADIQAMCASTDYMWSEERLLKRTDEVSSDYAVPRQNAPIALLTKAERKSNQWAEFEQLSPTSSAGRNDLHSSTLDELNSLSNQMSPNTGAAADRKPQSPSSVQSTSSNSQHADLDSVSAAIQYSMSQGGCVLDGGSDSSMPHYAEIPSELVKAAGHAPRSVRNSPLDTAASTPATATTTSTGHTGDGTRASATASLYVNSTRSSDVEDPYSYNQLLPGGGTPTVPHEGSTATVPRGGSTATVPHGGSTATVPHGGSTPTVPHGGDQPGSADHYSSPSSLAVSLAVDNNHLISSGDCLPPEASARSSKESSTGSFSARSSSSSYHAPNLLTSSSSSSSSSNHAAAANPPLTSSMHSPSPTESHYNVPSAAPVTATSSSGYMNVPASSVQVVSMAVDAATHYHTPVPLITCAAAGSSTQQTHQQDTSSTVISAAAAAVYSTPSSSLVVDHSIASASSPRRSTSSTFDSHSDNVHSDNVHQSGAAAPSDVLPPKLPPKTRSAAAAAQASAQSSGLTPNTQHIPSSECSPSPLLPHTEEACSTATKPPLPPLPLPLPAPTPSSAAIAATNTSPSNVDSISSSSSYANAPSQKKLTVGENYFNVPLTTAHHALPSPNVLTALHSHQDYAKTSFSGGFTVSPTSAQPVSPTATRQPVSPTATRQPVSPTATTRQPVSNVPPPIPPTIRTLPDSSGKGKRQETQPVLPSTPPTTPPDPFSLPDPFGNDQLDFPDPPTTGNEDAFSSATFQLDLPDPPTPGSDAAAGHAPPPLSPTDWSTDWSGFNHHQPQHQPASPSSQVFSQSRNLDNSNKTPSAVAVRLSSTDDNDSPTPARIDWTATSLRGTNPLDDTATTNNNTNHTTTTSNNTAISSSILIRGVDQSSHAPRNNPAESIAAASTSRPRSSTHSGSLFPKAKPRRQKVLANSELSRAASVRMVPEATSSNNDYSADPVSPALRATLEAAAAVAASSRPSPGQESNVDWQQLGTTTHGRAARSASLCHTPLPTTNPQPTANLPLTLRAPAQTSDEQFGHLVLHPAVAAARRSTVTGSVTIGLPLNSTTPSDSATSIRTSPIAHSTHHLPLATGDADDVDDGESSVARHQASGQSRQFSARRSTVSGASTGLQSHAAGQGFHTIHRSSAMTPDTDWNRATGSHTLGHPGSRHGSTGSHTLGHPGSRHGSARSATLAPPRPERRMSSSVTSMTWYYKGLSRIEAEDLLAPKSVGTFLLRDGSAHGGLFSISLRVADRCKHFRIVLDELGHYRVPGWPLRHQSMSDLLRYHMKHPISDCAEDILIIPCRKQ
ncbi:mucin-2-like isoform X2 [Sycon ciliatum]|uniref:mucin-2-like isoform X1 n=1 Tax=Sycon ciliatum TaxID=27933 RepID=UPI0031F6AFEA